MKRFRFFCNVLCIAVYMLTTYLDVKGQTISYDYDNNGNRIKSYTVTLKSGAIVQNDTSDLFYKAEEEEQKYEQELGETKISIFPNPTRGNLRVMISGMAESFSIVYSLYSPGGTALIANRNEGSEFTIDMNVYAAGIYILKLKIGGKESEWKIIKQ